MSEAVNARAEASSGMPPFLVVMAWPQRPDNIDIELRAEINAALVVARDGDMARAIAYINARVPRYLEQWPLRAQDRDIIKRLFDLVGWDKAPAVQAVLRPQMVQIGAISVRMPTRAGDLALRREAQALLDCPVGESEASDRVLARRLAEWVDRWLISAVGVPFKGEDVVQALLALAERIQARESLPALRTAALACWVREDLFPHMPKGLRPIPSSLEQPFEISIETFSKCNARCEFCPYPTLERQGTRMSEALFEKLLQDIQEFPDQSKPLNINLSRVNEPLLDHRLLHFMDRIGETLPQAWVYIPSNGSTLTPANVARLAERPSFKNLSVSLNTTDPAEHERIMGTPLKVVMRHLDHLHKEMESGNIPFTVSISHVAVAEHPDRDLVGLVHHRWPLFKYVYFQKTDWLGLVDTDTGPAAPVPPLPCRDWATLHILANGQEALCCFDGTGRYGRGDANTQHLLEIYNLPPRRLMREGFLARTDPRVDKVCQTCPLMM